MSPSNEELKEEIYVLNAHIERLLEAIKNASHENIRLGVEKLNEYANHAKNLDITSLDLDVDLILKYCSKLSEAGKILMMYFSNDLALYTLPICEN